jgi:nitroimidazol reductase NimA-like FMN-containing flavoprotein (pyridoxamine 5'-phosphate oxidase superfamily)
MDTRERAVELVKECSIATLASTGDDGPGACAIFYVWLDDSRFGFKSRRGSAHMGNLGSDERAAIMIYDHGSDYRSKVGVQLKGRVREARDADEMEAIVDRYTAAFDGAGKKLGSPAELLEETTASTFFIFDASEFRLVEETPSANNTMNEMSAW